MTRFIMALAMLALLAGAAPRQAAAQDNTLGGALFGGAAGAIIGGAATGRAGGAVAGGIIGAAAGAMLGSQLEPRPRWPLLLVQRALLAPGARRQLLPHQAALLRILSGFSPAQRKRAALRPPSFNATREEPGDGSAYRTRPARVTECVQTIGHGRGRFVKPWKLQNYDKTAGDGGFSRFPRNPKRAARWVRAPVRAGRSGRRRKEPASATFAADAYVLGEGACAKPAPYFVVRMTVTPSSPWSCAVASSCWRMMRSEIGSHLSRSCARPLRTS